LREFDIGAILSTEQIDVRSILLADSPIAPTLERRNVSIFDFPFSIFVFRSEKDLPWLH
jgi:hypothetical protein